MKITVKKPITSDYLIALDGSGVVTHYYADGTNSGPIEIAMGNVIHPYDNKPFIRSLRGNNRLRSDNG